MKFEAQVKGNSTKTTNATNQQKKMLARSKRVKVLQTI